MKNFQDLWIVTVGRAPCPSVVRLSEDSAGDAERGALVNLGHVFVDVLEDSSEDVDAEDFTEEEGEQADHKADK